MAPILYLRRLLVFEYTCSASGTSTVISWNVWASKPQRKLPTRYCPVLIREEREACLEESGFSEKDIASAAHEAVKAKAKRRTTVQNLNAEKTIEVEVAVESVRRAIAKAFVPNSKTNKQLYNTAA